MHASNGCKRCGRDWTTLAVIRKQRSPLAKFYKDPRFMKLYKRELRKQMKKLGFEVNF